MKWPGAAAKSRESTTDALATVTAGLVRDLARRPDPVLLRRALREWEFPPASRQVDRPAEIAAALRWLGKESLPLSALAEAAVVRPALDTLGLTMDRRPAAAQTTRRRHAGVSLWLNAGLPAPEVAQRAGHSVDVLLKVYAKCLDGDRSRMNERIEAVLSQ
ncbi:hypothetical protein [Micromonospora rubida]